jgi:hypothetical protein
MKRSHDVDFDALFDSLNTGPGDDADRPSSDLDDEWDDDDDDED